jgi:CRISPR/Cas system-associated exonuclease Cas4 (RecB family)
MYLSKSKLIAYRQCPKRLWLEIHKPEKRDDSGSEAAFAVGNEVGETACSVFDPEGRGVNVDPNRIGWTEARSESERLLSSGECPVFEALLQTPEALALADVMLPESTNGEVQWRMLEVKSSSTLKDYHRDDAAIQTHIARKCGVNLSMVGLAHINKKFVYPGDDNYRDLFHVEDLTEEADERDAEVSTWIEEAQNTAGLELEPIVSMGKHCQHPYKCGFFAYCSQLNGLEEDPLSVLPDLRSTRRDSWRQQGIQTLEEVPDNELNPTQSIVKSCTLNDEIFFDAETAQRRVTDGHETIYFLDFETINLAVPRWVGTRPYQRVPFQYSLHQRLPSGELEHREFLDITGGDPREALAEALIRDCGDSGVIYAYNMSFEKGVVRELAAMFPRMSDKLMNLHNRIDDLLPIARACYYNPSQKGSWSLKAVLPALCPGLDYSALEGVQHGGDAMDALREAVHPDTSSERRETLRKNMLIYCEMDTFATVRIWEYFLNKGSML